jgi:hypothetical protein
MMDDVAKRCLRGAVAEKSLIVTCFDVVTVDLDRRQMSAAMNGQCGIGSLIGHERFRPLTQAAR